MLLESCRIGFDPIHACDKTKKKKKKEWAFPRQTGVPRLFSAEVCECTGTGVLGEQGASREFQGMCEAVRHCHKGKNSSPGADGSELYLPTR